MTDMDNRYNKCLEDIIAQVSDNITEINERKLFAALEEQDYILKEVVFISPIIKLSLKKKSR